MLFHQQSILLLEPQGCQPEPRKKKYSNQNMQVHKISHNHIVKDLPGTPNTVGVCLRISHVSTCHDFVFVTTSQRKVKSNVQNLLGNFEYWDGHVYIIEHWCLSFTRYSASMPHLSMMVLIQSFEEDKLLDLFSYDAQKSK